MANSKVNSDISDLKISLKELQIMVKEIRSDVKDLKIGVDNRCTKLEDTVFGHEPAGIIGLAERVRGFETGWHKIVGGMVLVVTVCAEFLKSGIVTCYHHFIH